MLPLKVASLVTLLTAPASSLYEKIS